MTDKNEKSVKLNGADKIWEEIKNKKIEMFALPPQPVSALFTPFPADPEKLHLSFSVSSALPALEECLGKGFTVELVGRFIIVSIVSKVSGV